MTEKTKPRVPAGVGTTGRALWRRLVDAYELEPHELSMLEVACRQADDVAALEALIADQGMTVAGSQGQPRLNAAVAEVRQGRLALGKLLGLLALPDEAERPLTACSRTAQKAANARWSRKRAEQERREQRFATHHTSSNAGSKTGSRSTRTRRHGGGAVPPSTSTTCPARSVATSRSRPGAVGGTPGLSGRPPTA